jgi:hypothetical protein
MGLFQRLSIATVAVVTIPLIAGPAARAAAPLLTYELVAGMSPGEQGAILDPLRALAAGAVSVAENEPWTDIFGGVTIDAVAGNVIVTLTDPDRTDEFLAGVQKVDPAVDIDLAVVRKGAYAFAALKTAAEDLAARQVGADLGIESIAVPADGSGLRVRAFNVPKAEQTMQSGAVRALGAVGPTALTTVPIAVEPAVHGSSMSRLRDQPSWISGEAISQTSTSKSTVYACTSGLPARRSSDGRSFLITAGHCFPDGATVLTGWEGGGRNTIGVVAYRNSYRDAIAIDTHTTGPTASREWDGLRPGPYQVLDVSGVGYSYAGDLTCQDGYTSGIVCGLRVTNGLVIWTDEWGNQHAGVEAEPSGFGATAIQHGDSGGLVFALMSNNVRQARGLASWGDNRVIRWTEAPPILTNFQLSLAP